MADVAREQLDADIARSIETARMCGYLAGVVEAGPQRGGEAHRIDVVGCLLHAQAIVNDRVKNLQHVRAIYDDKVAGGIAVG